jgi:Trp operon repressor
MMISCRYGHRGDFRDYVLFSHANFSRFKYLKADVLLHCGRSDESLAILESLLARDPPTTAVSPREIHTSLFRVQQAKREHQTSAGQSMTELWRKSLKSQKNRKQFLLDWYSVAVRCNHWEDAQYLVTGCFSSS